MKKLNYYQFNLSHKVSERTSAGLTSDIVCSTEVESSEVKQLEVTRFGHGSTTTLAIHIDTELKVYQHMSYFYSDNLIKYLLRT